MAIPRAKSRVPRDQIGKVVQLFLGNEEVGDVLCIEDENGTYTITPQPRRHDRSHET